MNTLQKEFQQAVFTYACHVKSAELDISFADCWKAMCPSRPLPVIPEGPPEKSKDLLNGMRSANEFAEKVCEKYDIKASVRY